MMRFTAVVTFVLLSTNGFAAGPDWSGLRFLIGTWVSEDDAGVHGKSSRGETTFEPALEGRVIVRRNLADYPAEGGRPAIHHEDLLVVYPASPGAPARAKYFDNEGHVIDYTVTTDGRGATFLADAKPGAPRYRLSYRDLGEGRVGGVFEMAKPDAPDAFQRHLAWTMKKRP